MAVEIGQKYSVLPAFAKGEGGQERRMTGKVVYIHHKGRYAVLEFKGVHGNARESFPLAQLTEQNLVREKKRRCA